MKIKIYLIAMTFVSFYWVAPANSQLPGGSESAGASGSATAAASTSRVQSLVEQRVQDEVQNRVQQQIQNQVQAQVQSQVQDLVQTQVQIQVQEQVQDKVQAQVESRVQDQIQAQVQSQVQDKIQAQVQSQVQGQIQAQVQNLVQDQVQDQVQGQIQAQVQNQVRAELQNQLQSQIQIQSTRAAEIAEQLSATAVDRVQDIVQSKPGVRKVHDLSTEALDITSGNPTGARSPMAIKMRLNATPAIAITSEDVEIYDSIFGAFNPLVDRIKSKTNPPVVGPTNGSTSAQADVNIQADIRAVQPTMINLNSQTDFATQLAISARQRQAEISKLRDEAVASGNAELMTQADEMEIKLKAFANARGLIQTGARTQAEKDARAKAWAAAQDKAQGIANSRELLSTRARTQAEKDARAKAWAAEQDQAQDIANSQDQLSTRARTQAEKDARAKAWAAEQAKTKAKAEAAAQTQDNADVDVDGVWQTPRTANKVEGSANGKLEANGSVKGSRR